MTHCGFLPSVGHPRTRAEVGMKKSADPGASGTIVLVALIALAVSWMLPWWIMKANAPQYGQRTLVVQVGPREVGGDVTEVDLLGHYVGIAPMAEFAKLERRLAPLGMLGAAAGLLLAPWVRRRWLRLLFVLPVLSMPVIMLADLDFWMQKAIDDRDPNAALVLNRQVDPQLFGAYDVGQFKVRTELGAGFYVAGLAGLLGLGLVFAAPLPLPRRRLRPVAAVAGIVPLLGVMPSAGNGAVLTAGEAYPTIQAALEAARDGDVVRVRPGVYREQLKIEKHIRLAGEPGAVIDGGGEGTVVRILASGVEVRGLTVQGSGTSYTTEDAGIRIDHAADVRVVDTRIEDTLFGIFIVQGDRCVIESSTVIGKDLPHTRRGDGIRLWYSSGCQLLDNHVERSRDVIIWYSSDTAVEGNLVRTSRYGLHYMYSHHNRFHRNRFEDNQIGAAIMYSRDIELTENAFSFSRGPSAVGLLLKDADDVFILRNRIVDNATGIFLDGAPQSRGARVDVHGNLIARNDVGFALQPSTRRARFWENTVLGNGTPLQILGSGSAEGNAWAVDGRGNYWSEAVVYDADGDGVSDLPFRLERSYESLAERSPVLAFFQNTPGAEAIDLAARLFPIFASTPKLTDPHPLAVAPLTQWTRGEENTTPRMPIALAGISFLSLAVLPVFATRSLR